MAQLPSKKLSRKDFYSEIPDDLEIFDELTLSQVERMAYSLEPQEILDYFGLDFNELCDKTVPNKTENDPNGEISDRNSDDFIWFMKAFKRGRALGKVQASNKLFINMSSNQGKDACLEYLRRFSTNFSKDTNNHLDFKQSSFRVILDE